MLNINIKSTARPSRKINRCQQVSEDGAASSLSRKSNVLLASAITIRGNPLASKWFALVNED
jgi:hypothetical protein